MTEPTPDTSQRQRVGLGALDLDDLTVLASQGNAL